MSPSSALQAVCSYVTEKNYLEGNYEVKNMLAHFFDDRVHFAQLCEKIIPTDAPSAYKVIAYKSWYKFKRLKVMQQN